MNKIEILEYTKKSPKGRLAGRRVTVYAVQATDTEAAKAKALRTHLRRVEAGQLTKALVVKGAGALHPTSAHKIDYQIL